MSDVGKTKNWYCRKCGERQYYGRGIYVIFVVVNCIKERKISEVISKGED